jgi:hypothetical protein
MASIPYSSLRLQVEAGYSTVSVRAMRAITKTSLLSLKNTTHSENSIFGIQSYFRAQTVALDAN